MKYDAMRASKRLLLSSCWDYTLILKMEEVYSSESSVNSYRNYMTSYSRRLDGFFAQNE
jgi:hypothetical protein